MQVNYRSNAVQLKRILANYPPKVRFSPFKRLSHLIRAIHSSRDKRPSKYDGTYQLTIESNLVKRDRSMLSVGCSIIFLFLLDHCVRIITNTRNNDVKGE